MSCTSFQASIEVLHNKIGNNVSMSASKLMGAIYEEKAKANMFYLRWWNTKQEYQYRKIQDQVHSHFGNFYLKWRKFTRLARAYSSHTLQIILVRTAQFKRFLYLQVRIGLLLSNWNNYSSYIITDLKIM